MVKRWLALVSIAVVFAGFAYNDLGRGISTTQGEFGAPAADLLQTTTGGYNH